MTVEQMIFAAYMTILVLLQILVWLMMRLQLKRYEQLARELGPDNVMQLMRDVWEHYKERRL